MAREFGDRGQHSPPTGQRDRTTLLANRDFAAASSRWLSANPHASHRATAPPPRRRRPRGLPPHRSRRQRLRRAPRPPLDRRSRPSSANLPPRSARSGRALPRRRRRRAAALRRVQRGRVLRRAHPPRRRHVGVVRAAGDRGSRRTAAAARRRTCSARSRSTGSSCSAARTRRRAAPRPRAQVLRPADARVGRALGGGRRAGGADGAHGDVDRRHADGGLRRRGRDAGVAAQRRPPLRREPGPVDRAPPARRRRRRQGAAARPRRPLVHEDWARPLLLRRLRARPGAEPRARVRAERAVGPRHEERNGQDGVAPHVDDRPRAEPARLPRRGGRRHQPLRRRRVRRLLGHLLRRCPHARHDVPRGDALAPPPRRRAALRAAPGVCAVGERGAALPPRGVPPPDGECAPGGALLRRRVGARGAPPVLGLPLPHHPIPSLTNPPSPMCVSRWAASSTAPSRSTSRRTARWSSRPRRRPTTAPIPWSRRGSGGWRRKRHLLLPLAAADAAAAVGAAVARPQLHGQRDGRRRRQRDRRQRHGRLRGGGGDGGGAA